MKNTSLSLNPEHTFNNRRPILTAVFAAFILLASLPQASWALTRVPTAKLLDSATRKQQPQYTPMAKEARAEGQVGVEVTISTNGAVKDARAVSGHMLLRERARAAAAQWKFDPQKLADSPTEVIGVLVFNFKLH